MFLAPLLALAVASKSTCPPSGIAAVGHCFTPFFAAYNYSLFPDFSSFDNTISTIIQAQGWAGMESLCK
uniref:Secreted protein n=1 Tax=Panagrolaimus sp. JU765 TaxID=591449 RepID=A0AC34R107_9BILA